MATIAYDIASCTASKNDPHRRRRSGSTAKSAPTGVCRSGTAAKTTAASKPALDGWSSKRSCPAMAISSAKKRSWETDGHTTLTAAARAMAAIAYTRNHTARDMGGSLIVSSRHVLGSRHRPGSPRAVAHRDEDLLRLPHHVRRTAKHAGVSRVPRLSRRAAGDESQSGGAGHARGDRHRLQSQRTVDLRAEKLLLPRPAEGLPDLAVRPAVGHGRKDRQCAPASHSSRGRRGKAAAPRR